MIVNLYDMLEYHCCANWLSHLALRLPVPPKSPRYCTLTMKGRQKVVVGAVSPHEEAKKPGPGTYTLHSEVCGEYVNRCGRKNWVGPKA